MIIFASFGRAMRMQYGNRIIWTLYLLGSLAGGLAMNFGMPQLPLVTPQVGSDAALSAMITFYGMLNLHTRVLFFFFPVPLWVTVD